MTDRIVNVPSDAEGLELPAGWRVKDYQVTINPFGSQRVAAVITDEPEVAELPLVEGSFQYRGRPETAEFHPEYYQTQNGLEPWDVIRAFHLDYWRGNAVSYLLRAGRKGGDDGGNGAIDDIRKAWTFLGERLRELEREQNPEYVVQGSDIPVADTEYAFGSPLDLEEPHTNLGLATTAELLAELQARAEVAGYAQYRTVNGE